MTGLGEDELRARALSFGSVAAEYAALRPGYPADAVAFLVGEGRRRVLDLGAGTGLLTGVRELLAEHPDTRRRELLELPYVTRAYRLTPR
jgi:hypothetical protein